MCPHTADYLRKSCYICVLVLPVTSGKTKTYVPSFEYMCPHTTTYMSSYYQPTNYLRNGRPIDMVTSSMQPNKKEKKGKTLVASSTLWSEYATPINVYSLYICVLRRKRGYTSHNATQINPTKYIS